LAFITKAKAKDFSFKVKAKDFCAVLKDTSRPRPRTNIPAADPPAVPPANRGGGVAGGQHPLWPHRATGRTTHLVLNY